MDHYDVVKHPCQSSAQLVSITPESREDSKLFSNLGEELELILTGCHNILYWIAYLISLLTSTQENHASRMHAGQT